MIFIHSFILQIVLTPMYPVLNLGTRPKMTDKTPALMETYAHRRRQTAHK